jgi:PAS domain S-box-containing protein
MASRYNLRESGHRPHSTLFVVLPGVTIVAALIAITFWAVQDSHDAALLGAEQQERNMALVIRDEILQSIGTANQSLRSIALNTKFPGIDKLDARDRQSLLFRNLGEAGGLETLVADATGHLVYQSGSLFPSNYSVANRPQFQALRHEDIGLVFSPPLRSQVDGSWVIALARRIDNEDGSFGGAVVRRIPLSFFRDMFEKLDMGAQAIVTLTSTEGPLVVRRPYRDEDVGRDMSKTVSLQQAKVSGSGFIEAVASIDGITRLYYFEKVGDYPFVLTVGVPVHEIYADWLHKTIVSCSVLCALIVIGVALAMLLWRELGRRGRAEDFARNNENTIRTLVDNVADHAIYYLDQWGNVASWNKVSQRLKGYSEAEIVGVHFGVFFTAEEFASGQPARILREAKERGRFELRGWRVRKNGSQFWARIALTAIYDEAGEVSSYAKVVHDLTATQAEEAQRAIMIEAAPNGMLIIDERGHITMINVRAEQIFGYPNGALIGTPAEYLVPPQFRTGRPATHTVFAESYADGLADGQFHGLRKDGSLVPIDVMLRPVKTFDGNITVASVVDSTERLRRAAELAAREARERELIAESNARLEKLTRHLAKSRDQAKKANEAKSRFLTSVTHELRTPLNGILGYAQLLRLQGGLAPTQAANVEAMEEAGKHLLGMINAVLDLSQIESDRIEMHAVDIDVRQLAQACLNLVSPAAVTKSLALSLTMAASAPEHIVVDSIRLRQILVNLLGNAIKFTAHGSVELRLTKATLRSGLRVEVADTGPGISSEHREKLFREFERFGDEASTSQEGSGLGLAITARLIERMGGQMGYDDNPEGGSIFWAEFPENSGLPDVDTPAAKQIDRGPAGISLRILVVDDVEMNRDVAAAFLRLDGHEVVCVDSGQAAIETLQGEDFGVILMDVRMPGIDGLEATRRIRKLAGNAARVPIVAMTAQAFTDQIEQCRQAGMDGHIAKPFQYEALLKAVGEATTGRAEPSSPEPFNAKPLRITPPLPVIDEAIYEETVPFLDPEALEKHLRALTKRSELLLVQLRGPDTLEDLPSVADAAHSLGGAAGTFGFTRLAETAKMFERSTRLDATEIPKLSELLIEAVEASILKFRELLLEAAASSQQRQETGETV